MFGFFKKKFSERPSFSYEQAVILTIAFDTLEELGGRHERTIVERLEKNMYEVLPDNAGIDGHEFGAGECVVYVYGPSANTIWEKIEPVLKRSSFNHVNVTLQFGKPDDPKTKDKNFTL